MVAVADVEVAEAVAVAVDVEVVEDVEGEVEVCPFQLLVRGVA